MLGDAPLDLKRLSYFVVVADELHFGRAAARLFISQPALSQQIKALEASLGIELFIRGSSGVTLSADGQGILPDARLLLVAAEQLVEQARSRSRSGEGILSLGYHEYALGSVVPTFLAALRSCASEVSVTLTNFPLGPQALAGLVSGQCDAVVMAETSRTVKGLRSERLSVEEMVAAVPADHPLADRDEVPIAELAAEPFAFFYRSNSPEVWENLMTFFDRAGRRPRIEHVGEQLQEALLWVGSGQGVTMVPATSAASNSLPGVEFRRLVDPTPTQSIVVAWIEPNSNPRLEIVVGAAQRTREMLEGRTVPSS